jgi:SAM-dependent methyltransferase
LRNGVIDMRYGRPLSGRKVSRYRDLGSRDVANSDYGALVQIFRDRVLPEDVLVDIGCGKGRVLNFWLRNFPDQRVIGVERDPEIALATRQRLRRHANCNVVVGDAGTWLPSDGTLFFLYNPFDYRCTRAFVDRLNEIARATTRVLYSNPLHCDVFLDDPRWSVGMYALQSKGARYDDLAVISRATKIEPA